MRLEGSAAYQTSSEIVDTEYRTGPFYQTEGPSVLVVGRSATIRQILYIILNSCGFKVIEAEHWAALSLMAPPSDVELVVIDADPDLFPDYELHRLDESVPVDVPTLLLTDGDEPEPEGRARPVITIPKLFTWEAIVGAAQMATLLHKRSTPRPLQKQSRR